jgi:hypothetical protein
VRERDPEQDPDHAQRDPSIPRYDLPLSKRSGFSVDTASGTFDDGDDVGVAVNLAASAPITANTFVTVALPLGFTSGGDAVAGNIPVGTYYLVRYAPMLWFTFGTEFGLPLLPDHSRNEYKAPAAARAFWDLHDLTPDSLPVGFQSTIEWHTGIVELRGDLQLTVLMPIGGSRNDNFALVLQHAFEIQIGHRAGGGLRAQGVWPSSEDKDNQAAIEPFFVFEHRSMFLRFGLILPLDAPLGPPFITAWGARFATGLRFE